MTKRQVLKAKEMISLLGYRLRFHTSAWLSKFTLNAYCRTFLSAKECQAKDDVVYFGYIILSLFCLLIQKQRVVVVREKKQIINYFDRWVEYLGISTHIDSK